MDLHNTIAMAKIKVKKVAGPLLPAYRAVRDQCRKITGLRFKADNEKKLASSREYLESIRSLHAGERCFIIGNGPSLTVGDLDKLKGQICFGCNAIYNVFTKTDWRPTYYCAQDTRVIASTWEEISQMKLEHKFIAVTPYVRNPDIDHAHYLPLLMEVYAPELPKFSQDITKGIYEGFTVTYMNLQVAAYMGFKEIILLGVDHSASVGIGADGKPLQGVQQADHFYSSGAPANPARLDYSTLAYKAAKNYADAHGMKILNATRGGNLEVFERVDFDSLF